MKKSEKNGFFLTNFNLVQAATLFPVWSVPLSFVLKKS